MRCGEQAALDDVRNWPIANLAAGHCRDDVED